jgi:hypothetical protein
MHLYVSIHPSDPTLSSVRKILKNRQAFLRNFRDGSKKQNSGVRVPVSVSRPQYPERLVLRSSAQKGETVAIAHEGETDSHESPDE